MTEPKLLPCPWCGEAAEIIDHGSSYRVVCSTCWPPWGDTRAEAIAAWNRRTPAVSREEPLEMFLCESDLLILRPDQPYVFRVDHDCEKCREIAATYAEAQP